jgi:hypothetical protein
VQGRGELAEERQFFLSARFFFLHCWRRSNNRLGLSATSQQYFSLRTNQSPATSQPAVLFSQKRPAPAISQPNRP